MNYHIITFGCQMNKSDSERIATSLEKKGYSLASNMKEADLIVVNMCSVRQSAVDRVNGLILKLKKMKALPAGRQVKTALTGCILKKDRKRFKFDEIWDSKNYFDITPTCQSKSSAFVPISNGCNNFCSYCVVPFARGRLVCRSHQQIIKEFKRLIKNGFKEIWLLGQNVNDYNSPSDKSINFAKLLKMVNQIPGDFSIRFMSPNPKNFTNELISAMAESKKVAKYLNLPVQSGDDEILKKMKRSYTVKQYKDLIRRIRRKMPKINLSTDAIIGYPGETKKQFQNTAKLFKEIGFDMAYISKYSPRSGTAAFQIKDNITLKEKKQREKILRKLIKKHEPR
ncbi:MAG: MiaB/RimO family radical SAM methylthiotransferase [Candidatus Nealsonbacteria bacterium]|nr:MiaB/RimO family radical SAM methylthiotransferase [Candidatus Nealsonbacteria bacterium]